MWGLRTSPTQVGSLERERALSSAETRTEPALPLAGVTSGKGPCEFAGAEVTRCLHQTADEVAGGRPRLQSSSSLSLWQRHSCPPPRGVSLGGVPNSPVCMKQSHGIGSPRASRASSCLRRSGLHIRPHSEDCTGGQTPVHLFCGDNPQSTVPSDLLFPALKREV